MGTESRARPASVSGFVTGMAGAGTAAVSCPFCQVEGGTELNQVFRDCERARKVDVLIITRVARAAVVCYRCLDVGHIKRLCTTKSTCLDCGRNHVTVLHGRTPDWFTSQPGGGGCATAQAPPMDGATATVVMSTHNKEQVVYHGILPVFLGTGDGGAEP